MTAQFSFASRLSDGLDDETRPLARQVHLAPPLERPALASELATAYLWYTSPELMRAVQDARESQAECERLLAERDRLIKNASHLQSHRTLITNIRVVAPIETPTGSSKLAVRTRAVVTLTASLVALVSCIAIAGEQLVGRTMIVDAERFTSVLEPGWFPIALGVMMAGFAAASSIHTVATHRELEYDDERVAHTRKVAKTKSRAFKVWGTCLALMTGNALFPGDATSLSSYPDWLEAVVDTLNASKAILEAGIFGIATAFAASSLFGITAAASGTLMAVDDHAARSFQRATVENPAWAAAQRLIAAAQTAWEAAVDGHRSDAIRENEGKGRAATLARRLMDAATHYDWLVRREEATAHLRPYAEFRGDLRAAPVVGPVAGAAEDGAVEPAE